MRYKFLFFVSKLEGEHRGLIVLRLRKLLLCVCVSWCGGGEGWLGGMEKEGDEGEDVKGNDEEE